MVIYVLKRIFINIFFLILLFGLPVILILGYGLVVYWFKYRKWPHGIEDSK
jgi:hypothetical protein